MIARLVTTKHRLRRWRWRVASHLRSPLIPTNYTTAAGGGPGGLLLVPSLSLPGLSSSSVARRGLVVRSLSPRSRVVRHEPASLAAALLTLLQLQLRSRKNSLTKTVRTTVDFMDLFG